MKSACTFLVALMIVDGLSWRASANELVRYTAPDNVTVYSIVPLIREQPLSSGGCVAPVVVAEGSRVFAITAQPAGGTEPIAFRVTSPQLAGFELFIHNNGSGRGDLQCSEEFALPNAWGNLHVSDEFVVPLTEYAVQADCGAGLLSESVSVTTYRWGDTDFSGIVNLDDLLCVLLAFSGGSTPTCNRYSAETSATFAIGIDDILGVLSAFSGQHGPTLPTTPVIAPELPVFDNPNPDAVCSGGFICLTATASPGLAIEWSSSCGGSFNTSDYHCVEPIVATTYYARTRNSLGCRSDCASVTVPVNPLPPPPDEITANVFTVCIGESIELTADVPPGTDVEWFSWGCEEIPEGTGTSILVSPTETTKYFARSIDSNGCISSICTSATIVVEGSPEWVGGFHMNGFDGPLNALAVYDSGAGSSLFAGTNSFSGVRQWDGTGWLFMDSYAAPAVFALAVFDDGTGPALFSGGNRSYSDFSPAGGVRKWDGAMMTDVAHMSGGPVRALAVFDDGNGPRLFAAGSFTTVFGVSGNPHIVKWNGTSWSKLPIGQDIGNSVYAMTVFDDGNGPALYAGGDFTTAGGHASAGIARWDGTSWTNLGSGLNGRVRTLIVFDDGFGPALYAGGDFTGTEGINSVTLNHVGKWNGTTWSALGVGVGSGTVHSMAVYDDGFGEKLYVGGTFSSAGGSPANRMAKWSGASWSALDNGVETTTGVVSALGVFDDGNGAVLYAGGDFDSVDGISVDDAAKWDGFSWSTMKGQGMNDAVEVLSVVQVGAETALYAGGAFDGTGAGAANHIAKWDGDSWSPLAVGSADGVDGVVLSISGHNDGSGASLFAGGDFATAVGMAVNNVAKWDGSNWSSLGSGTSDVVRTLASFDDGSGPALCAGGDFLEAGGSTVDYVASWNGSSWLSMGGGMNERVEALAVFDLGDGLALYAGGHFTLAGGTPANYVARWDGDSWVAMGSGVIAPVVDLDVFDDGNGPMLYASYGISGQTLSGIMRWDGNTWADLPGGDTNDPSMMTVYDDGTGPSLYVGGSFGFAGGVFAAYVARWDGTNWYPLDDGMNYVVDSLVGFDDGSGPALFVGGSFYIAWDTISDNIAKWQRQETSCPDP